MVMTLGNLIDKFSTRRRSATVGNEQQDCKTSGENLYNSFDRALGDISEVILRESATIATDFPQIQGTPPTSTEVIFNDSAMSKDEERTIGSINQLQQRFWLNYDSILTQQLLPICLWPLYVHRNFGIELKMCNLSLSHNFIDKWL